SASMRQVLHLAHATEKREIREWTPRTPEARAAPRARHLTGARTRFLRANGWCASNWRKDKTPLQSAAGVPGNPNACRGVGTSRRRRERGWGVRMRVSLRSAAHRRRSILLYRFCGVPDGVVGCVNGVIQVFFIGLHGLAFRG